MSAEKNFVEEASTASLGAESAQVQAATSEKPAVAVVDEDAGGNDITDETEAKDSEGSELLSLDDLFAGAQGSTCSIDGICD